MKKTFILAAGTLVATSLSLQAYYGQSCNPQGYPQAPAQNNGYYQDNSNYQTSYDNQGYYQGDYNQGVNRGYQGSQTYYQGEGYTQGSQVQGSAQFQDRNLQQDGRFSNTQDTRFQQQDRSNVQRDSTIQNRNVDNTTSQFNRSLQDNRNIQDIRNGRSTQSTNYTNTNSNGYVSENESFSAVRQSDNEILNRVKAAIKSSGPGDISRNVTVRVENGYVILLGNVANEGERQQLKDRIQKIMGVKGVDDQTQLLNRDNTTLNRTNVYNKQVSDADTQVNTRQNAQNGSFDRNAQFNQKFSNQPASNVDAEVKTKIQDALKGGMFTKGYQQISFDVRNGHVILSGTVKSDSDKSEVIKRVRDVEGVQSIDDQIRIENT